MDSFTSYKANESDDWIVKLVAEGRYFGSKYGPVMRKWILLSGALTSVDQLFDVYLWNYRQLTHGILMFDSGIVDGTTDNGTGMDDRITVNAYAMNYVSNGVNLVEFLEAFCNAAKKMDTLRPKSLSMIFVVNTTAILIMRWLTLFEITPSMASL